MGSQPELRFTLRPSLGDVDVLRSTSTGGTRFLMYQ
jgi:hypothetical protein